MKRRERVIRAQQDRATARFYREAEAEEAGRYGSNPLNTPEGQRLVGMQNGDLVYFQRTGQLVQIDDTRVEGCWVVEEDPGFENQRRFIVAPERLGTKTMADRINAAVETVELMRERHAYPPRPSMERF